MNESSSTPSPAETTRSGHCPVWWCVTDHLNTTEPDHYGDTDGKAWPEDYATGDIELSGLTVLASRPVWFAEDGMDPLVCLNVVNEKHGVELNVDLRIDEAARLVANLQRVLAAAKAPLVRPTELVAGTAAPLEELCDVIEDLHKIEGRIDDAMRKLEAAPLPTGP